MISSEMAVRVGHSGRHGGRMIMKKNAVTESPEFGSGLLAPIVAVLTLIALVNSLQAFYIFFAGDHSLANFLRYLASNLFYAWYFMIPALAVRWLSTRVSLNRKAIFPWAVVHLFTLILLTSVHQTASLEIDKLILGSRQSETVFDVLFNNPGVWGDMVVYILFLLGFYMIEYRKKNQENEIEYSRLEMELVRSRLNELRSRIHPAFLFNTLNEVGSLVRSKRGREANKALSSLSDFLRTTVYDNDREDATVEDEIVFLNHYLAIEEMRFRGMLRVSLKLDETVMKAQIPNFIIQPIAEELITKNLDNQESPCDIEVATSGRDRSLEITMKIRSENHTAKVQDEIQGGNILDITRQRLAQTFDGSHEFDVLETHDGWGIVRIRIPLRMVERMAGPARVESR